MTNRHARMITASIAMVAGAIVSTSIEDLGIGIMLLSTIVLLIDFVQTYKAHVS